jgi:outer membrane protein OmpA-like peptidoglycan-associated protein
MRAWVVACLLWAGAAEAQPLDLPANAQLQLTQSSDFASYAVPVGPWADGQLPQRIVQGALTRSAWRLDAVALTSLQILQPLRDQLRAAGFTTLFECESQRCGGFDFRFATDVLPPPQMQINLGNFVFLAAQRSSPSGPSYITLFVSRTAQAGFVQITQIAPVTDQPVISAGPAPDLAQTLATQGRAVLPDLGFATGSDQLDPNASAVLADLARYLIANPAVSVILVGHSDLSGALDTNIALSRQRAVAVLDHLANQYGVSRAQMSAQGVGYLAPLATNQTSAGRAANRRVEVLLTTQNSPPLTP